MPRDSAAGRAERGAPRPRPALGSSARRFRRAHPDAKSEDRRSLPPVVLGLPGPLPARPPRQAPTRPSRPRGRSASREARRNAAPARTCLVTSSATPAAGAQPAESPARPWGGGLAAGRELGCAYRPAQRLPPPARAQTIAHRRRLQRPHRRIGPRRLRRSLRPAGLHHRQRLLRDRSTRKANRPLPFPPQRRARSRQERNAGTGTGRRRDRLGPRDLARHRDRARDLPELPDPARRGRLERLRRPRSRRAQRGEPRSAARSPTRGAAPRKADARRRERERVQPAGHRDHRLRRRRRLSRAGTPKTPSNAATPSSPPPRRTSSPWAAPASASTAAAAGPGETVWNGSGAGGGGCSVDLRSPALAAEASGWSSVGCTNKRAVADVAADADPYTGAGGARHEPRLRTPLRRRQSQTRRELVHDRRHEPRLPADRLRLRARERLRRRTPTRRARCIRTRWRNRPRCTTSPPGSNGECLLGYDDETGLSGCTPAEEAATSCSSHSICLAGPGYDGPTGVGTPTGSPPSCRPRPKNAGGGSRRWRWRHRWRRRRLGAAARPLRPGWHAEPAQRTAASRFLAPRDPAVGPHADAQRDRRSQPQPPAARADRLRIHDQPRGAGARHAGQAGAPARSRRWQLLPRRPHGHRPPRSQQPPPARTRRPAAAAATG